MTVGELIERLQKHDAALRVFVGQTYSTADYDFAPVEDVGIGDILVDEEGDGFDEDDDDTNKLVRAVLINSF